MRIHLSVFCAGQCTGYPAVRSFRRNLENAGSDCVVLNPNAPLFQALEALEGYRAACEASGNGGRYDFAQDLASLDDNEEGGVALTADWELSGSLALKSITAFRRLEWETNQDVDGTGLALVTSRQAPSRQDQWSQEFQLQGASLDGDLLWTAGLYYFREEAERPAYSEIFPINRLEWRYRETDNKSYAAYGQATYAINPKWSVTAGLRYTYEERYFLNEEHNLVSGQLISRIAGEDDFDAVTPMLNLAYTPFDGLLLYASWSQGFKAGGFNARSNPDSPFTPVLFDPRGARVPLPSGKAAAGAIRDRH